MTENEKTPAGKPATPAGNDTPRILDELSRNNTAKANTKTRRQRLRVLLILALLTPLLLGLAFTAYQQWQVQGRLSALQNENAQLREQQASAESELLGLVTRLNNQMGDLAAETGVDEAALTRVQDQMRQELNAEVQNLEYTLEQTIQALQGLGRQQADLEDRNAEALYVEAGLLLRMAQRKLTLDSDIDAATLLLESVLDLAAGIDTARAVSLRNSVQQDLRRLQATRKVDIVAIHAQLAALAADMENLSLVTSLQDAYEERLGQSWQDNNPASTDTGLADAALALLGSIFVWREWEEVPEHMLPPQQEYYVREQMRLLLEQARLAVLMRQESLFRDLLRQTQAWMNRYQLQQTEQGRQLIQQIDALMRLPLVQTVPDITSTISLVEQTLRLPPARPVEPGTVN